MMGQDGLHRVCEGFSGLPCRPARSRAMSCPCPGPPFPTPTLCPVHRYGVRIILGFVWGPLGAYPGSCRGAICGVFAGLRGPPTTRDGKKASALSGEGATRMRQLPSCLTKCENVNSTFQQCNADHNATPRPKPLLECCHWLCDYNCNRYLCVISYESTSTLVFTAIADALARSGETITRALH